MVIYSDELGDISLALSLGGEFNALYLGFHDVANIPRLEFNLQDAISRNALEDEDQWLTMTTGPLARQGLLTHSKGLELTLELKGQEPESALFRFRRIWLADIGRVIFPSVNPEQISTISKMIENPSSLGEPEIFVTNGDLTDRIIDTERFLKNNPFFSNFNQTSFLPFVYKAIELSRAGQELFEAGEIDSAFKTYNLAIKIGQVMNKHPEYEARNVFSKMIVDIYLERAQALITAFRTIQKYEEANLSGQIAYGLIDSFLRQTYLEGMSIIEGLKGMDEAEKKQTIEAGKIEGCRPVLVADNYAINCRADEEQSKVNDYHESLQAALTELARYTDSQERNTVWPSTRNIVELRWLPAEEKAEYLDYVATTNPDLGQPKLEQLRQQSALLRGPT